jgi:hypothetical protein
MANFQVSTSLLTFDATMDTGSEATDRTVSNVELPKCPFRTWRSTDTSTQKIELDLGANSNIDAIMLHNGNFTLFDVEMTPASPKTYVSRATDAPFAVHSDVNRRKSWLSLEYDGQRYIRITPKSIVAGQTYWELGSVIVFGTVVTLADNPSSPRKIGHRQAHTMVEFAGGGFEINEDGEPYVEYWVENPLWKRRNSTIRSELFSILNAGMAAPIGLYENQADPTKCYLFGRTESPYFNEQYATFEMGIALREYV